MSRLMAQTLLYSKLKDIRNEIKTSAIYLDSLRAKKDKLEKEAYHMYTRGNLIKEEINGLTFIPRFDTVCSITDYKLFLQYIIDNDKPDLINKSVNNKLYFDIIKNKTKIPGTKPFNKLYIKIYDKEGKQHGCT